MGRCGIFPGLRLKSRALEAIKPQGAWLNRNLQVTPCRAGDWPMVLLATGPLDAFCGTA